jgi:hypothetical protein
MAFLTIEPAAEDDEEFLLPVIPGGILRPVKSSGTQKQDNHASSALMIAVNFLWRTVFFHPARRRQLFQYSPPPLISDPARTEFSNSRNTGDP